VQSHPRARLLETAYRLFSTRGVRAVGVDEVVAQAGVAKATLYHHFASKDDLVVAFLQERERRWTFEWVEAQARQRGETAEEHLLGIFDLFDEWFRREDFEGCSFINVLLEMSDADSPLHRASATYLARIRSFIERLAAEAGICDSESFARQWHILMK